jgi:hypothetical protein
MSCKQYLQLKPASYFAEETKCFNSLNCESNCACWEGIIDRMFNYGLPFPNSCANFPSSFTRYIYNTNLDPCDYYNNGSRFPYEIESVCVEGIQAGKDIRSDSLYLGNCTSDKRLVAKVLADLISEKEKELYPKENKFFPETCISDLSDEILELNSSLNILLGCEAPWVLSWKGPYVESHIVESYGTPPCDGFNCFYTVEMPYNNWFKQKQPDWEAPNPLPEGCSPPPPPSPSSPSSPPTIPPPPPTPGCINGGWFFVPPEGFTSPIYN